MKITTIRSLMRILCFALGFYLIFESTFIIFHPFDRIEPNSIYGNGLPLRDKLVKGVSVDLDLIFQPLPLLTAFQSHTISRPKAPNEFRIALLGDSGTLGIGNSSDGTISALMTTRQQIVLGKKIVVYNLAWPPPGITKDLLIAFVSLRYHPDMFIWLISPLYMPDNLRETGDKSGLLQLNAEQLAELSSKTGLNTSLIRFYSQLKKPWWQHSIIFERDRIVTWLKLQMQGFDYDPTVLRYRPINLQQLDVSNLSGRPVELPNSKLDLLLHSDDWIILRSLSRVTSTPFLIVNEPILIAPDFVPGAKENYDGYFARIIYDRYRKEFNDFCHENDLWCLDIWNLVPPQEYTNTPLHRTDQGNTLIADRLLKELTRHFSSTIL